MPMTGKPASAAMQANVRPTYPCPTTPRLARRARIRLRMSAVFFTGVLPGACSGVFDMGTRARRLPQGHGLFSRLIAQEEPDGPGASPEALPAGDPDFL